MSKDYQIFTGSNEKQPENLSRLPENPPPWRDFNNHNNRKKRAETYQVSGEHEIEMVNAALLLRRPLLITGKPGTGKSSLAHAVAHELDLGDVLIWSITSKSTLQHGLYNYDALARLQDASLQKSKQDSSAIKELLEHFKDTSLQKSKENNKTEEIYDIGRYIHLGAIGTAFLKSEPQKPCVILIDEIDKSDIDLPNDLLHLFEEGEFEIPELARLNDDSNNETVKVYVHGSQQKLDIPKNGIVRCKSFPLVIMTSNGEREFPPAFLRRCLRLKIEPPTEAKLQQIVKQHLGIDPTQSNSVTQLITEFLSLRDKENKEIATDQLLNAIYLVMQDNKFLDKDKLRLAIFAALTEN